MDTLLLTKSNSLNLVQEVLEYQAPGITVAIVGLVASVAHFAATSSTRPR